MRAHLTLLAWMLVASSTGRLRAQEDPVLKARAQRAAAQGVSESDLPPVPRGIVEPPPLPPPELHPRDMKGSRAARAASRGGRKSGKAAKGGSRRGRRSKRAR